MKSISAKEYEAIRIVPLHLAKPSATISDLKKKSGDEDLFKVFKTAATPKLIYSGGPLLKNVEVFTIFWGANWAKTPSYVSLAQDINKFFSTILTSSLIDQLAEYNTKTPVYTIGHGTLNGTKTITANAPVSGKSIQDSAIQKALKGWISAKTVPPVNANRLYFIYTDINVKVIMGGSASCTSFCGYHNNNGSTYYAVMPFPGCTGCLGGLSAMDALTGTSSHELCEAITDPVPGSGWYDQINGEIGDICAWKFKTLAGYNVQLEWSNKKGKCV